MKIFLHSALGTFIFFSPFPLFIDANNFTFFINFPPHGDFDALWRSKPNIPVPIVFITAGFIIILNLMGFIRRRLNMSYLCKPCMFFAAIPLSFLGLIFLILGVDFVVIFQVYMGVLFISFIPVFLNPKTLDCFAFIYLYGILVWLSLHTASILYFNGFSVLGIGRGWNYSTFFGVQIYQSQVSYSAILSLFVVFAAFMGLERCSRILGAATFILACFLGLVSQTRLFFLDFVIIASGLLLMYRNDHSRKFFTGGSKSILLIFSAVAISFGLIFYGDRLSYGAADRLELILVGLNDIYRNPEFIFWGAGSVHSYAHNYFVDFVLNYGLISLLFVVIILLINIYRMYNILSPSRNGSIFLLLIMAVAFTNSTFNSAVTQPLFMAHVFLILLFITSYIRTAQILCKRYAEKI